MATTSSDSELVARSRGESEWAPHRLALIIMWSVATTVLVIMLFGDVRHSDEYGTIRYALHGVYVATLLWHFGRTGTDLRRLPELSLPWLRFRFGAWIPVIGIALLLLFTALSDDGTDILLLLLILATALILLAWRKEIRLGLIVQGLGVALIAYLAGRPFVTSGFAEASTVLLLPAMAAPMYVAGVLLFGRTRLGGVQLAAARYGQVLKSFVWGCLLFVPLGLFNAAEGSPGTDITWVTEWWMPLSLPWFSGIAEEIWFRLLLVGLCYLLLRPAFRKQPAVAVIAAVLFSGITFGLGHDRTLERFLTTGLLYGVPMAAVFAKRDWEHAVGAHYMVNMIPWVMVFLEY